MHGTPVPRPALSSLPVAFCAACSHPFAVHKLSVTLTATLLCGHPAAGLQHCADPFLRRDRQPSRAAMHASRVLDGCRFAP